MGNNIILIGFMGAGKTSVGKYFSQTRHKAFIDTDTAIEAEAGIKISEIFERDGEEGFRLLETKALEQMAGGTENSVISTGGGLPLREENRRLLRRLGTVIYLKVLPETVLERLEGDTSRPLLQGSDVRGRVKALLELREPLYQEAAQVVIQADGKSLEDIGKEIEEAMVER